jgi:CcmD family protein
MIRINRLVAAAVLALTCVAVVPASAQSTGQTPPQQQDEFVPISQLPPQDQLPAAPLLISAYVVVLLALFAYVLSVSRRLSSVQREVERLEGDLRRTGRA